MLFALPPNQNVLFQSLFGVKEHAKTGIEPRVDMDLGLVEFSGL